MKIRLMEYQTEHIELKAYEHVKQMSSDWEWKGKNREYWIDYFKANIPVRKQWSDYAIQLINEYPVEWIKINWQKKLEVSIRHWAKTGSAVTEKMRDACRVLSNAKDVSFLEYKEELWYEGIFWAQVGHADISRQPILKVFNYPQDSPDNQARYYIEQIIKRIDTDGMDELFANKELRTIVFGEDGTLEKITKLPERLSYLVPWASGVALSGSEARARVLGAELKLKELRGSCTKEELIKALSNGARRYFSNDVKNFCSWRRMVITILRGDTSGTYMGFSGSFERKKVKALGLAAFAERKEEREKAIKEYKELQEKIKSQVSETL